jgi:Flp pilus assembly protein TadD
MLVCPHCHLLFPDAVAHCPHDGTQTASAQVPPLPPSLHAKLSQIEPFAQGQTGTCYVATQTQSGRRGLVKLVALSAMAPAERVRLKRELRKQTQLAHDGLPKIFDGGELGSDLWLFRELVDGESLAQRIRRLGKLEVGEALTITAQVASALDELQRSGLLHRDVKPGHIILAQAEGAQANAMPIAKLIDAGVAARLSTGSVFDLIGTPAYISPEQVAGKLVSFRSDLYALGCVLYEMLQGEPPFPSDDVNEILEAHKNLAAPTLALPLPPTVQTLLHAMLAKEPRQRPFSAQQVRRTLEPLLPKGARLPPLGARPVAPLAAAAAPAAKAAAKFPRDEDTQEIDLDEIELPSQGPQTMHLGDTDLAELALPPTMPPRTTVPIGDEELGALQARVGDRTSEPVATAPEPAVVEAPQAAASKAEAPSADAASAAPPAAGAAPARPSVAFDVESLFDDDVPPEAVAPAASAPADELPGPPARAGDEEGPATQLWTPAVVAPGPSSEPPIADPEGTVMVARPGRKRSPMIWIAVGSAALLVLLLWWSGGDDEPSPAAEAAPTEAPPEAVAKVEPVGSAAKQEPATGRAAEPAAAPAEAANPEPAAQPAEPAAAAPAPEQAAAVQAEPAQAEPGTAAPAAAEAVPAPGEPPVRATAPSQSGGGANRLSGQRAARTDRLAKAEELKAQGRAHFQGRRYREAAASYQKATELNPSDAGAYAGLGASRLEAGDANAAVQAYSNAVRLQGTSSGFHAALGRAYLKKGDRGRARSAYQKALELNPNNAAARTALAQIK